MRNATARDWEDIATGPRRTLWLADIGDNHKQRSYVSVYRVSDPTALRSADIAWTQYDFCYPNGEAHNAEALLVRPHTGRVLIVSKQSTGAMVYHAKKNLSTGHCNALSPVATAPGIITAGDFAPDGRHLALRNGGRAYIYRHVGGSSPRVVTLPIGGESLAFNRDGSALFVGKEGVHSPVYEVPIR